MLPGFRGRPVDKVGFEATTAQENRRCYMKQATRKRAFAETSGQASPSHEAGKDSLIQHVLECPDPRRCTICAYARSSEKWEQETFLERHGSAVGTWLVLHRDEKTAALGLCCWVCRKQGLANEFAKGTISTGFLGNLKRHGESGTHQYALSQLGLDNRHNSNAEAPDVAVFQKALDSVGQALSKGLGEECGRWKRTQLQWALAEADRQMTRDFLRDSVSIAIAQDGRHSILHMRFSASQRNLTVLKGYVGSMQVKHGETITNLKKGMLRVLDRLCTPGLGGPHEGPPDLVLRELLQKRVTICVADAAYNEQGALRACAEAA